MDVGTVVDVESNPCTVSPAPSTVFIKVCLKHKVLNKCTINLCFKMKLFVVVFGKLHLRREQIGPGQNESDTAGKLDSFERPISMLLVLVLFVEFVNAKGNANQ